ncbi:uncharacterized protein LOC113296041 [Papaver somniferum]|uniref:uncharacterized protein LOC113296041 n=1 Tax=Papaver somniferum TaxID=3469 RepID=UPI000E6F4985|nr:uncharacterized protein LOC113296041 [Papaver somniferum]
MEKLIKPLNYPNHFIVNTVGIAGGLCIFWKDGINLKIIGSAFNVVNCEFFIDARSKILMSCMYGALPNGNPFTWSNKRRGDELIQERLYRVLGNDIWFNLYNDCHVYHLAPIASDHNPIVLTTSRDSNPVKRPIKFNRYWNVHTFGHIQTNISRIYNQLESLHSQGIVDTMDNRIISLKDDNLALLKMLTHEEIKDVVFNMKPWTFPGPDSFPPGFYQQMWHVIGNDTVKMVQAFFIIIFKLLSNRLKPLLSKIINPFQTAFVQNKLMTDNIVIAHELVDTLNKHKSKKGLLAIKLDMSKAFDRIEWTFLEDCLKCHGFDDGFCKIIMQYVTTVSTSFLLNGTPGIQFKTTRGLRQRDPLSPYLFILCMYVFSKALMHAQNNNLIKGVKITPTIPSVSHIFFADDLLIFTNANPKEVRNLNTIIEQFSRISGQAINYDKSGLAFSPKTCNQDKNTITNILNIRRMGLQEKYLGVLLLLQKNKSESFSGMFDKFGGRLGIWRAKHINQPARTVFTQTVLGSIDTHQMSVFPMPKKFTDGMDGGLNIRQTAIFNQDLLAKLAWMMLQDPTALWVQILMHKYLPNCFPLSDEVSENGSWIWRGICKGLKIVKQHYCWEIADGKDIIIWKDKWIHGCQNLVSSTNWSSNMVHVSQLIDQDTKYWNLSMFNTLFPTETVNQICRIRIPMLGKDRIRWTKTRNGQFTVKSTYNTLLDEASSSNTSSNTSFPWKI